MLSDVGDLARMRYGVRKLAELVQQPAIVGITDMDDEAPMLMGRDPSADGSTSNAAFPSRMPPAQVLAMSDDELDAWMVFNCGDGRGALPHTPTKSMLGVSGFGPNINVSAAASFASSSADPHRSGCTDCQRPALWAQ